MVIRLFNILTIGLLLTFILFVTGFFFIGSYEAFDKQLDNLPEYFLRRTVGGVVIGLLGCIVVGLGNLLIDKRKTPDKRRTIFRIMLWTMLLSVIISAIGTGIFLFH